MVSLLTVLIMKRISKAIRLVPIAILSFVHSTQLFISGVYSGLEHQLIFVKGFLFFVENKIYTPINIEKKFVKIKKKSPKNKG